MPEEALAASARIEAHGSALQAGGLTLVSEINADALTTLDDVGMWIGKGS